MTASDRPRPQTAGVMRFRQLVHLLWFNVWWKYPDPVDPWLSVPYHLFNLFEGSCWAILACLVLRRYLIHRRSFIELAYAVAFLTFGLTDFREAYELASWLVRIKLLNLRSDCGRHRVQEARRSHAQPLIVPAALPYD
jgi:hypothetical protein